MQGPERPFLAHFQYIFCAKPLWNGYFLLTAGFAGRNSFSTNFKVHNEHRVFKVLKVRSLRPTTKFVPLQICAFKKKPYF